MWYLSRTNQTDAEDLKINASDTCIHFIFQNVAMVVSIYRLTSEQQIKATLQDCWKFFSNPRNLAKITPSSLDFRIKSELPEEIYAGLLIKYRVRPLAGIPVTWLTEITHARAPYYFSDEQRVGPYAIWHHEHFFEESDDGYVLMKDMVHYRLPFAPFSNLAHPVVILPQIRKIFDYRKNAIAAIFNKS